MKHSFPHDLGKDGGKRAVLAAFASYAERYAKYRPTASWTDGHRADVSFSAKAVTLKGALEVKEQSLDLDLDVPFLLRPFKDRALRAIEKEIAVWIARAKAGQI